MVCQACGYDAIKGDKPFVHIKGDFKVYETELIYRRVFLFACPKCHTVRFETEKE